MNRRADEVEGVMTHGRNLDFSMTAELRPDTIIVDLTKGNRTLSTTAARPLQILISAVSASVDTHIQTHLVITDRIRSVIICLDMRQKKRDTCGPPPERHG